MAEFLEVYWRATHPPVKSPPQIRKHRTLPNSRLGGVQFPDGNEMGEEQPLAMNTPSLGRFSTPGSQHQDFSLTNTESLRRVPSQTDL